MIKKKEHFSAFNSFEKKVNQIENPFILKLGEDNILYLKLLDKWTDNGKGNEFYCKVTLKDSGEIDEYKSFPTEKMRDVNYYNLWFNKDELENSKGFFYQLYKFKYNDWEKELERLYKKYNIKLKNIIKSLEDFYKIDKEMQDRHKKKKRMTVETGIVYLVNMEDTRFHKIGMTTNLKSRMQSLQNGNPIKLKVVKTVTVIDPYGIEKDLHNKYKDCLTLNEWFEFDEEKVSEVIKDIEGFGVFSLSNV